MTYPTDHQIEQVKLAIVQVFPTITSALSIPLLAAAVERDLALLSPVNRLQVIDALEEAAHNKRQVTA